MYSSFLLFNSYIQNLLILVIEIIKMNSYRVTLSTEQPTVLNESATFKILSANN